MPKYKRVILKVSGEALAGEKGFGLDEKTIGEITDNIKKCRDLGVQIAIVCGGGSILRAWQQTESDGNDYLDQAQLCVERMKRNLLRYITIL